ncbi:FecR family protein [Negadavirga shengliensis]|uniref:FecR family protein n=1 Tax=Negadavirga shengliensis TaxID=1389218 RepID=A0ABV9SXB7_9BACT
MDKHRFLALLEKQAKGQSTPEENRLISEIYDRMQDMEWDGQLDPGEERLLKERMKQAIDAKLFSVGSLKTRLFPVIMKVAAGVLLVLSFSYLYFSQSLQVKPDDMMERQTSERQKATVTLVDGSLVHLNVNSRIRFPKNFGEGLRRVELEGEAFFEVVSDQNRPFVVESGGVTTRVLGTSFNVNAHIGKDVEVAVRTGKVGVSQGFTDEERQLVISPNQKVTLKHDSKDVFVEEVDMDQYLLWRAETIAFHLESFDQVVSKLGKVYNLNMVLEGFKQEECLIKATYSNRSLYTVLLGLKNLVDFEYEKKDASTLVIRYKGCKN